MPELFDNNSIEQWAADGSKEITERALAHARKLLEDYEEPRLDDAADEALRDYIARREREIPAVDGAQSGALRERELRKALAPARSLGPCAPSLPTQHGVCSDIPYRLWRKALGASCDLKYLVTSLSAPKASSAAFIPGQRSSRRAPARSERKLGAIPVPVRLSRIHC